MAEPSAPQKPSPTTSEKIAAGATSLGLARIVTRSFDLITLVVLTRCLLPADFGLEK